MPKKQISNIRPLSDGTYRATCKERSLLAAGMNGHSLVYPVSIVTVRTDQATFRKDGKTVWTCSAAYAAMHFHIEKIQCE